MRARLLVLAAAAKRPANVWFLLRNLFRWQ